MPKYIAFLRAVNIGGHTVKMEHLRGLFEALGFANVATFIASGNVIFESGESPAALEQKIQTHLRATLGYAVETFLRTPAELAQILQHKPFSDEELSAEGHGLHIAFLRDAPRAEAQAAMLARRTAVDDFSFHGREMYWLCRGRFSDSLFKGNLEKLLGGPATVRNSTTVRKLAAKYPSY
jgi:uncharacterized protein (DUF1697 family)